MHMNMTETGPGFGLLAGAIMGAFLLAGCYSSSIPLGDPLDSSIDADLVGIWETQPDTANEVGRLQVFRFNEHEYFAEMVADTVVNGEAFEKERARFRVFTTPVGDVLFANVQAIDSGDRSFGFYRVDLKGDVLRLTAIQSDLFREGDSILSPEKTFGSSTELKAFVAKNVKNEKLYDSDVVEFRRAVDE